MFELALSEVQLLNPATRGRVFTSLQGKNALLRHLTYYKMTWLHLLWAWDKVINFAWTDLYSVMFSIIFCQPNHLIVRKTVRKVSSKWIDHRKFCGIIMLAYMVCVAVLFRKGRRRKFPFRQRLWCYLAVWAFSFPSDIQALERKSTTSFVLRLDSKRRTETDMFSWEK